MLLSFRWISCACGMPRDERALCSMLFCGNARVYESTLPLTLIVEKDTVASRDRYRIRVGRAELFLAPRKRRFLAAPIYAIKNRAKRML